MGNPMNPMNPMNQTLMNAGYWQQGGDGTPHNPMIPHNPMMQWHQQQQQQQQQQFHHHHQQVLQQHHLNQQMNQQMGMMPGSLPGSRPGSTRGVGYGGVNPGESDNLARFADSLLFSPTHAGGQQQQPVVINAGGAMPLQVGGQASGIDFQEIAN